MNNILIIVNNIIYILQDLYVKLSQTELGNNKKW